MALKSHKYYSREILFRTTMTCKATIFQRIMGYFRYRAFVKTRYKMIQVAIQLKEVRESIEQLRREIHERK